MLKALINLKNIYTFYIIKIKSKKILSAFIDELFKNSISVVRSILIVQNILIILPFVNDI